ncbi:MAG TPA: FAD-binding oxidoreductase [Gemmatimonadaceae bacterium]|nr:FAD-binding oxidoreductase [Gemmatimonadaceae bacterium]
MITPPGFRGAFRDDDDARGVYSEAAGIARIMPRAVAVPADAEDVVTLAAWAQATHTPLIPRGAGSSMAGAAIGDGVIVDLSQLAEIGPVDTATKRIWVGPGAVRDAVNAAANEHGLWFPVDPSSGAWATIAGMVATNAAGPHTLKHGAMRHWVTALECVFDDGARATIRRGAELPTQARTVAAIRRFSTQGMSTIFTTAMAEPISRIRHAGVRKESSGYALVDFARTGDLVDLFVGSEGTLALIVGVELQLAEMPAGRASICAGFPTLEGAVDAATRAASLGAATCELLDRTFLDLVRTHSEQLAVPDDIEAMVLMDAEAATQADADALATSIRTAFEGFGATGIVHASDLAAITKLWHIRHAASPLLNSMTDVGTSMQFIEDGAVPPQALAEYVRGVRGIMEHHGFTGVIFGHAGDAHVHVNPLVDVTKPGWRTHVSAALEEVVTLTCVLGGTLAGEHGDGRLRTPFMERVWANDAIVLFDLVKRCFDPRNILNPGVKVPLPGQKPLGDIKYDPALAPLSPPARAALDHVASARAYGSFRLDLLAQEPATQAG